jgi:hypothetical protein
LCEGIDVLGYPVVVADKLRRKQQLCLDPKFGLNFVITSNVRHMHGILNINKKITNFTVR